MACFTYIEAFYNPCAFTRASAIDLQSTTKRPTNRRKPTLSQAYPNKSTNRPRNRVNPNHSQRIELLESSRIEADVGQPSSLAKFPSINGTKSSETPPWPMPSSIVWSTTLTA